MSSPALKIQTPLICALRPNKVHAKSLPGAGRLPRPWIKQPVFIRRVGHQAISNGLGAWKQEITCERSARITRNLWPPRSCAQR